MTQPAPSLDTDEQLSGRAADAVADMQHELARRYSGLNSAEAQLAEALLAAHATTTAGRERLQDIQRQLVEAINSPVNALDTPAGERQFLMFLRSKVAEIQQIIDDGVLTARDQAELTRALAGGYVDGDPASSEPSGPTPVSATSGPPPAAPSQPASPQIPAQAAGAPPMGIPSMPQAAGGLPQAASPLAGLGSLLGRDDNTADDDPHGIIPKRDTTDDDDPEEDTDDENADDDPAAAPDDAAPEDAGPAPTRPAVR